MKTRVTLAAAACMFFCSILLRGAHVPPPVVDINAERADVNASISILENELLNNDEEEYILLAPNDDYFTGFNDAMTEVITELTDFDYTGVENTDFQTLGTSLLLAQNAAETLDTTYGMGESTAYGYAIAVLNRKFDRNAGDPPQKPKTQAELPATQAALTIQAPAVRLHSLPIPANEPQKVLR